MRSPVRSLLRGAALASILALVAACDSPEERARTHHERAVALVAEGETERAALEFRNALRADPEHKPSLAAFGALLAEQDDLHGAIRQYLRLAAVDPEDADVHLQLAKLSLMLQDFGGVEEYTELAHQLDPDNPEIRGMLATVAFRRGSGNEAVEIASGVLAEVPGNVPANMVMIAERMALSDFPGALALADAALEHTPASEDVHVARLSALSQMGDDDAVGAQLLRMAELFDDNEAVRQGLIQWHLNRNDTDAAVAMMREAADRTPDEHEGYLNIAQFLLELEGPAAARAELEALAASRPDPRPYKRALAQLDFAEGRSSEAITALQTLIAESEPAPETRELQMALARMYEMDGKVDEAMAIAAAVLEEDDRNVEGLKMRARRYIDDDQTELALADLRRAATEAPRDPEIMLIMAAAHEREGATELVGERLARAVEASAFGAKESLQFAQFLMRDGRPGQAEGIVLDALRRAPQNRDLLLLLGQIHLQREDFARAAQVVGTLRSIGTPAAIDAAAGLEIATLQAQDRLSDAISLLERLASEGQGGDLRARIGLVQARLAAGDNAGALQEIDAILAVDPDNLVARMLLAGVRVVNGDLAEAEMLYRGVIEERPELAEPYAILFSLLNSLGRQEEALATLDAGIEDTNRDASLLTAKASLLYSIADYDGAIELYEELYARDSGNIVVANNLASLISTHRADPENLERAFQVARRLRGTDVPHFQDTYGWLLVQRGDSAQALRYLEPAAASLSGDPLVHYHLGMAYLALERWEDARVALARAVELGQDRTDLPQIAAARERIAEIDARPPTEAADG